MAAAGALAIFSGKIIYKFGIPERLRTLRYSIFTGGVVKEKAGTNPLRLTTFASSPEGGAS